MLKYVLIAALLATLGLSGLLWWETSKNAVLRANVAALTLALDGCNARAENLTQDKESDNEIDRIPDDDLRDVPDRWLRSAPG